MNCEVIIVGAGIAGLSCARVLSEAGCGTTVLERARGVGGRCATRRVKGQPIDHGVVFLHGSDPEFLTALRGVPGGTVLEGWPYEVSGHGSPCQPEALSRTQSRLAYTQGVTAFPKSLAQGLDVRLETRVVGLGRTDSGFEVVIEGAAPLRARSVVLALATEQSRALLEPLAAESREAEAACALLGMAGSLPCLTVMAGYPPAAVDLGGNVLYPEDSAILQLVADDASKRVNPTHGVVVFQARPSWSRGRLAEPEGVWTAGILAEAGRLSGDWASRPLWTVAHRWLHARSDRGNELREPLLLRWPGGIRLGLAGEIFSPGGGVEAAWRSGRALARRFLNEG